VEIPSQWRIDWARVPLARPMPARPQAQVKPDETDAAEAAPPGIPRAKRPAGRLIGASRDPRRARLWTTAAAMIGLVIVAAAAGVYLLSRNDDERARGTTVSPSGAAGLGAARPARTAFVASGVRFTVVPNPHQAWTGATGLATPGSGFRWQTVAVLYRNLTRHHVTAEQLRFRLADARGRVYLPDPEVGNAGRELPPRAQIPVGRLIHGQLAFRVRTDAEKLMLVIDPSPRTRVRVPVSRT
jgi:hypothetical protein